MTPNGCTVILPTYNEAENIGRMISCLRGSYPNFKILVMDDNSKDGTIDIVNGVAGTDGNVRIIVRDPADKGLTASTAHGITETDTEFFINMDSDFQHPPSALENIYKELTSGADLVIGLRTDREALPFKRRIASLIADSMANFTLRFRGKKSSSDIMSGLFGGRTDVFADVVRTHGKEFEMRGFKILFDLLKYAPYDITVKESPYEFGERQGGESKIGSKIIFSVLRQCGILGKMAAAVLSGMKR